VSQVSQVPARPVPARPVPVPTPETQPFWDGCAAGELRIQRCLDCDKPYFYPRPVCPACGSAKVEWFTATGRATLYSYVINHRPAPGFSEDGPYAIAVVQLGRAGHGSEPRPSRGHLPRRMASSRHHTERLAPPLPSPSPCSDT
jgi:uncharacterized OB-fold protein